MVERKNLSPDAFEKHFVDISQSGYESGLVEMINSQGYATFEGIQSPEHFSDMANRFGNPDTTWSQVINYSDKPELSLHTDGVNSLKPPLIFLYCELPANSGGESTIVDGKTLYSKIREENPDILKSIEYDMSYVHSR